ncbi:Tissue inhibitor of metalloproteinase [Popillia japonica]|uniref:Tissue inhibitor of metalloproteinase n=1 Tax=Popillia japonica TaxID=7064 RepID=A0AAW1L5X1_POPJA
MKECLDLSELCSCHVPHPQEAFCKSDFVILARVKQYQLLNETIAYKVRIRKHFKMSEKAEVALKSGRLLTPRGDSVCQNTLTLGKIRRQRKGLKMMYRQGCVCQIASCYSSLYCQKRKGACLFSTLKRSCYDSEGICLPSPSKVCRWAKSAQLNKCVDGNKLTISRWSG